MSFDTENEQAKERTEVDSEAGYRTAVDRRDAEAEVQRQLNETINRNREEHRLAWEETEVADAHRQTAEAERIMRLRTPDALEQTGQTVGDPTKGPSS